MSRFAVEPEFSHDQPARIGVLLVNLGTPDAPTAAAVKPYLRQFLSDPRVVEIPKLLWQLILRGVILNVRPKKSAHKYASIWSKEGSPLQVWTQKQARLLKGYLGERLQVPLSFAVGMRYGEPSIAAGLDTLKTAGCDRILLMPLYPQYAASTTATACDAAFTQLMRYRNQPALRTVRSFHDHAGYIDALAGQVRAHWQREGRGDHLLMSFHGLPRYTLTKGDPYFCHCHKTARLLADALELDPDQYTLSFQSRFGKAEWLKPYTADVLTKLGKAGVGRLDVICPGFAADCLETLEEIAIEGKETFLTAGGGSFRYIACLNDNGDWIKVLADLVERELSGWLAPDWQAEQATGLARESRERARKLGASK
ncbi:ferrochelatase [Jeongeupia naejangsanensis]|uniref:Ferrochelatase n=1 Tax=Jeongeupia naejangsanensis TaxID=613195 RepID=A0ABS2BJ21_9NEIS|nr:ferrochelatase [Jeongeupia naejangsanensis]MBM3115460.1 ferrochelatase [Jeongeupia naejangsanensis]